MGNGSSRIKGSEQKKEQQTIKFDELNLIAQLKILLIEILKEFKNQGEDVSIFEEQMRSRHPDIKRGENFQARLDQKGDIIGIAKIFNHDKEKCSIYIGEITNKKPSGRGVNIKVPLITNQKQKTYSVGRTTYQAHLMQSWENKDNLMKGCLFKKKNNTTQFFKGQFLKQKIHRGRLTLKENQIVKMMYIGEFKNSLINGRGTLIIPGKSKYTGEFQNGNKQGIGQQEDQLRNTYYVGQFQANYRHGYGELTYKNRDNVKLKGFWNDGVMKPDEGVYVNKDGIFLEKFGNDVHLI